MARRRGATPEDEGPSLTTLDEQQRAVSLLNAAFQAGELDEEELRRRLGRVHRAVTPRQRSDWREIKRAVALQVAIVGFAAIAMLVVLYGVILYHHGNNSGAHIWPWQWGES